MAGVGFSDSRAYCGRDWKLVTGPGPQREEGEGAGLCPMLIGQGGPRNIRPPADRWEDLLPVP